MNPIRKRATSESQLAFYLRLLDLPEDLAICLTFRDSILDKIVIVRASYVTCDYNLWINSHA